MMQELTPKEKKQYAEWLKTVKRIQSGSSPINNETLKQKRYRIDRLLDPENFEEACNYYFDQYTKSPFAWFHHECAHNVLIDRWPNNQWEIHREGAKSVLADIFIPFFLLQTGWLEGMILGSETEDKAKKLIGDLQAELEYNPRITHDFGSPGITGSWIQGYFQTKSGIGFWGFGLGQNPSGTRNGPFRPNLGVLDDADSKKMAKNQKLTKEKVSWVNGEFKGCLQTHGSIFINVNNRVVVDGLTAHLAGDIEEGDPIKENLKLVKVYFVEDPLTHAPVYPENIDRQNLIDFYKEVGAQPAWKENFTLEEAVDKIIDLGFKDANRQLFHRDIKEGTVFSDETLPWTAPLALHEYDALVSYCDSANGESGKGCYRSVVFIGVKGHDYHVLWAWLRKKGSYAKAQYDLHQRLSEGRTVWRNERAGFRTKINCQHFVECNSLQKPLLKRVYQEFNLTLDHPWYPKYDEDKKGDKDGRIESLETTAQHKHLLFNEDLRKDKDMILLRNQFMDFPDGDKDGPDAVEGAISKLRKKTRKSNKAPRTGNYHKDLTKVG